MKRSAVLLIVVFGISAAVARADVPRWKEWICRPGISANYCNTDLSVTAYRADGTHSVRTVPDTRNPPIDCFYLYPTVSTSSALRIRREEKIIAVTQAARFSQVCRVFAPLYRQTTIYGNGSREVAYQDVLTAWRDYLAHWNNGRGVVLVGHSQGAGMLEQLIQEQYGSMRKLLVSALVLGGGVSVGSDDRFAGVPACRSSTQTNCIVAYATWNRTPPKDTGTAESPTQHELCVNPAAPSGGSAAITPIFPWFAPEGIIAPPNPQPSTFWVSLPGLYTARCVQQGQRAWLLISRTHIPGDNRPSAVGILGRNTGSLHAADVNIALGELIALVRTEGESYVSHH